MAIFHDQFCVAWKGREGDGPDLWTRGSTMVKPTAVIPSTETGPTSITRYTSGIGDIEIEGAGQHAREQKRW